jgi:hypothetical protein
MEIGKPGAAINRLVLIAAEDVGIADPSLISYERMCSDRFDNLVKLNGIKRRQAVDDPECCEVIDRAAIAAAISSKSRLLTMASIATICDIYENEHFSQNLSEYLDRFDSAVEEGDERRALYYAYVVAIFLNAKEQILARIGRHRERRNEDLVKVWAKEYRRSGEMLTLVGSVVLLFRDLDFAFGEYNGNISQYLSVPIEKANIPDRAYDKHTAVGKRRGRGYEHFFNVAGTLRNERFANDWEEDGRAAYIRAYHQGLDKMSKVVEAIKERLQ